MRGARGRHRNEGCTVKSQMGGGGQSGAQGVNGAPIVTPLVCVHVTVYERNYTKRLDAVYYTADCNINFKTYAEL